MQTKSENHETCRGVVLSHVEAGVADMLDDTHQAQFAEGCDKEEMEATADAFYLMLD